MAAAPALRPGQRNLESRLWVHALTVHGEIYGRLNRAFLAEFGITLAKFDVLAQVSRAPEGLTQGQLTQSLKVSGGNVTGLVRRLGSDGLVLRSPCATDGRSFIVRITPPGAALFAAARQRHDFLLEQWFAGIAPDDLASAHASLQRLSAHVQRDHVQRARSDTGTDQPRAPDRLNLNA